MLAGKIVNMLKTKNKQLATTLLCIAMLWLNCSVAMMAQKQFSLEDLNFGGRNYKQMIPQNIATTWWGDELIRTNDDACLLVNKTTGKEQTLFTT